MNKPKVLVALSGGVDSSVAAILLKESGYELVGITLNTFERNDYRTSALEKGYRDASILAGKINIPYYVINIQKEFNDTVIEYFIKEYHSGKTPDPCALCNFKIKWTKLLEIADEFDCEYIATGHYAKINQLNGRYYISEAEDFTKDQSWFLWRLNQEFLKRTIFPLGEMTKQEIKKIAVLKGFEQIARKKESYDICFIPEGGYRQFLKSGLGNFKTGTVGDVFSDNGRVIGKHEGIWNYTIGQREEVDVSPEKDLYVLHINADTNSIIVGNKDKLLINSVLVKDCNFVKYENINQKIKLRAKLNYRSLSVECTCNMSKDGMKLNFMKPVKALAPGQSVVLYEGNDLVAGGVIA